MINHIGVVSPYRDFRGVFLVFKTNKQQLISNYILYYHEKNITKNAF